MTHKTLLLALTLVLGLFAHVTSAHAQVAQFPRIGANACDVTSPSSTTFGRGLLGFYNSSTSATVSVTCTLPIEGTSATTATTTVKSLRVYFNDNNAVSGRAVSCTAYLLDAENHGFTIGTRHSCATAGGCTSSSNTFSGSGYLQFSSPNPVDDAAQILVMCNLPPISSGWAVSSLFSVVGAITVQ